MIPICVSTVSLLRPTPVAARRRSPFDYVGSCPYGISMRTPFCQRCTSSEPPMPASRSSRDDSRITDPATRMVSAHGAVSIFQTFDAGVVRLVQNVNVGDLHDTRFDRLNIVAHARARARPPSHPRRPRCPPRPGRHRRSRSRMLSKPAASSSNATIGGRRRQFRRAAPRSPSSG